MNASDSCIGVKLQSGKTSVCCGKIRAPGSPYCPHHQLLHDDLMKEPQRRKERAQQRRDERKAEEEFLATSPLRADNPQFVERSGRNRRAITLPSLSERPISQPGDEFQVDPDPVAEVLAILASADFNRDLTGEETEDMRIAKAVLKYSDRCRRLTHNATSNHYPQPQEEFNNESEDAR